MWARVYTWRRRDETTAHFLYGYAAQLSEEKESTGSLWREKRVKTAVGTGHWVISCFSRHMAEGEVLDFVEELAKGRARIATHSAAGQPVTFDVLSVGLVHRPPVYVYPRQADPAGPETMTDTVATCESWWTLDKEGLVKKLFPPGEWNQRAMEKAFAAVLDTLAEDTGIDFRGRSPERFGNFDILRCPVGSLEMPAGVYWAVIPEHGENEQGKKAYVKAIRCWVDGPIAERAPLLINCRLWNGGGAGGRPTVILDEVKEWLAGQDIPLIFRAEEPVCGVELRVWEKASGKLLWHTKTSIMRQIEISLELSTGKSSVADPWSQRKLGDSGLRSLVEEVRETTSEQINVAHYTEDPWVESAREARWLVDYFVPQQSAGEFYFPVEPAGKVGAFKFFQKQLARADIDRAVLADPFFTAEAALKLLTRTRNKGVQIEVITSLTRGYDPDTGIRSPDFDPVARLIEALEQNVVALHPNLCIYNIQNKTCSEQQFHDRYFILYRRGVRVAAYMLSNSINAFSARFPFLVVPLDNYLAKKVDEYVAGLLKGEVPGRKDVICVKIWDGKERLDRKAATLLAPQSILPGEPPGSFRLPAFEGWETVLDLLEGCLVRADRPQSTTGPKKENVARRLADPVSEGLLLRDKDSDLPASWAVPEGARDLVATRITKRLAATAERDAKTAQDYICVLVNWAYNGSCLNGEEFLAAFRAFPVLVKLVREMVKDRAGRTSQLSKTASRVDVERERLSLQLTQLLKRPISFVRAYEMAYHHLSECWEYASVMRGGDFYFLLPLLWGLDAAFYLETLIAERSAPLLAWLIEAGELGKLEDHQELLLASGHPYIKALAAASLWGNGVVTPQGTEGRPYAEERVNQAIRRLVESPLERVEKMICLAWWYADAVQASQHSTEAAAEDMVLAALIETWPRSSGGEGSALSEQQLEDILMAAAGGRAEFNGGARWNALAAAIEAKDCRSAQRIRTKIVDSVVRRLPLKSTDGGSTLSEEGQKRRELARRWPELISDAGFLSGRKDPQQARFSSVTDYVLTREAAIAARALYGTGVYEWFRGVVLQRLRIRDLREPLLRERNYDTWARLQEGALWALYFGMEIVGLRSPDDEEALGLLRLLCEKFVAELCPSIWSWPDDAGLLAGFLIYLGYFADQENEEGPATRLLAQLAADSWTPRWRQVFLYLICGRLYDPAKISQLIAEPFTRLSIEADRLRAPRDLKVALRVLEERNKFTEGRPDEPTSCILGTLREWFKRCQTDRD